jgi:hypothetical protein
MNTARTSASGAQKKAKSLTFSTKMYIVHSSSCMVAACLGLGAFYAFAQHPVTLSGDDRIGVLLTNLCVVRPPRKSMHRDVSVSVYDS